MQNLMDKDIWIFDLDNTLYSNESELFAQVGDRMTAFIQSRLSLEKDEASRLRKEYYEAYGTTLRGLMQEKSIEPHDFLKFVHDVDYKVLKRNDVLRDRLLDLKKRGKRLLIYTNSSCEHTNKVLECLGLEGIFEAVFDIEQACWHPKPSAHSAKLFFEQMGVDMTRGVMFDDLLWNLVTMKKAGVSTVWIDREETVDISSISDDVWSHVDCQTKSLEHFLEEVLR